MLTFEYCLRAKVFHCLRDAAGFAPGSFWKRVEIATDFPVNLHHPALVWRYQFFPAFIRGFTKYSGHTDTAECFVRGHDLCTLCAAQRQDKRNPVKQARLSGWTLLCRNQDQIIITATCWCDDVAGAMACLTCLHLVHLVLKYDLGIVILYKKINNNKKNNALKKKKKTTQSKAFIDSLQGDTKVTMVLAAQWWQSAKPASQGP